MTTDMHVHQVDRCPSCHGTHADTVPLGDPPLRRCGTCSLVYAPQYADPSDIYVEGYLFGDTDFGLNIMHPIFQEFLAHAARIRMHLIERTVGTKGTMLDVGCGTGEVLAVAEARGWTTSGVEPVEQSAQYAAEVRGLQVLPCMLQDSGLPERSFDVVSAFHVLEHMTDAQDFLLTIARWVKPGGHVVIEVPNWHSFHRRNAGGGWSALRPLEHVGHYEPSTLKATLVRAGLKPVAVRTPGFLWNKQTLDQQMDDLGLYRWKRRLQFLGRSGEHDGQPAVVPRKLTGQAFLGLQSLYGWLGVGQVVLAVARVP